MSELATLRERLIGEGLDPGSWSNGPGDRYGSHRHGYDKVIVVASGSITFGAAGTPVPLAAGDRLVLPAGTEHDAVVGSSGVVCLEGHLASGTLAAVAHRRAGEW